MIRRTVLLLAVPLMLAAVPAPVPDGPDLAACTTLRSSAPAPVGTGACPGVRPGATVVTEDVDGEEWTCTLGFVFDGVDREDPTVTGRYITAAGTCAMPWPGEVTWEPGEGPRAFDADGGLIGRYVYAVSDVEWAGRQFALIAVDPEVEVDPQACYFGGPTGIAEASIAGPVQLRYVGQGAEPLPGRSAVARDGLRDWGYGWATGAWVPADTGGPVLTTDGAAVGIVAAGGAMVGNDGDVVTLLVTRLAPELARAGEVLGVDLELVTAPLL